MSEEVLTPTPTPAVAAAATSTSTITPEPTAEAPLAVPASPEPSALAAKLEPSVEVKPVTFEDLKLPEGSKPEELTPMLEIMNSKELSPAERSQKLLDLYATESKKVLSKPAEAYAAINQKWRDEMQSDPEIGGDKLRSTVLPAAVKVIAQFGNDKFRQALDLTGMGNNPEMARFLYKVAQALGEGSHVGGNPIAMAPKRLTAAEAMYPSLVKGTE